MAKLGADLVVEGLTLDFDGLRALDGVGLQAAPGELVAVIGPNGAGKSSLFNCISGLYRPSQGSIRLGDRELIGLQPHRIAAAGVARAFQSPTLFDELSVLDNVLVGAHHRAAPSLLGSLLSLPAARRVEARERKSAGEVLARLELDEHRDTPAGELPYGLKKRVELARALNMQPSLLLLDEPAAGLGPTETAAMADFLRGIRDDLGITQVLIDHDLGFVVELASRVTVLDFGVTIATERPDVIATHPAVIEAYLG
ncbi:MAG: ABC transporter ATP-binding protein [Deltaproteobacteria bacterium]|nr:ABC transporter ATP-binding protein [Deltaproteobacteria bacterium]